MSKQRKKLRHGVYLAGLVMESVNRAGALFNKKQPFNQGLIYHIYKIGRFLKK